MDFESAESKIDAISPVSARQKVSSFRERIREINMRASMRSISSKPSKASSFKETVDLSTDDKQVPEQVPKLHLSSGILSAAVAKDKLQKSNRPTSARVNFSAPQYQRFIRPQTARARMQKNESGGAAGKLSLSSVRPLSARTSCAYSHRSSLLSGAMTPNVEVLM
mmetsp:Transcript_24988/g.82373  ORF Transcript_24988/g.82373 Transcript_24988/m.82373 type:complete len:166 (+) Transcript_24988:1782-2279(+)